MKIQYFQTPLGLSFFHDPLDAHLGVAPGDSQRWLLTPHGSALQCVALPSKKSKADKKTAAAPSPTRVEKLPAAAARVVRSNGA